MNDGKKDDKGKPDLTQLRGLRDALATVCRVLDHGAKKYGRENYRMVASERYDKALLRHALAPEERDEESGELHAAHVAACALIYLQNRANGKAEPPKATPPKHPTWKTVTGVTVDGPIIFDDPIKERLARAEKVDPKCYGIRIESGQWIAPGSSVFDVRTTPHECQAQRFTLASAQNEAALYFSCGVRGPVFCLAKEYTVRLHTEALARKVYVMQGSKIGEPQRTTRSLPNAIRLSQAGASDLLRWLNKYGVRGYVEHVGPTP